MYRNRKTAAIFAVVAALVLALIFTVGHSLAASGKASSDKNTATSDNSPSAENGSPGNGNGADLIKGRQNSGASHASDANGSGQGANGSTNGGSTSTTPPTTTPPGGGGFRPPFQVPVGEADPGLFGQTPPPPTTTPPNHNPDPGYGAGCVHKAGFSCP